MVVKDVALIKKEIASKGMSLRRFSNEIGVSHCYLSQVLNDDIGKRKSPSPTIAKKICDGVERKIGDFF